MMLLGSRFERLDNLVCVAKLLREYIEVTTNEIYMGNIVKACHSIVTKTC